MAKGDLEDIAMRMFQPSDGLVISIALDGYLSSASLETEVIEALKSHCEEHLRSWFLGRDSDALQLLELWVNTISFSDEINAYPRTPVLHWKFDSTSGELPARADFSPSITLLEEFVSVIAGATQSFIFFDGPNDIVAAVVLNTNLATWLMQIRQVPGLSDWSQVRIEQDVHSGLFTIRLEGVSKYDFEIGIGFNGEVYQVMPESNWPEWSSILPGYHMIPVPIPSRESEYEKPWPTQDGLDRSGSFAIVNADLPDKAVGEALGISKDEVESIVYRGNYQIGPAAEGSDFFLFELLSQAKHFHDLVGPVVDYLALAEIVRRTFRAGKKQLPTFRRPSMRAFSPVVLQHLCHLYVKEHFHPKANLESKWEVLTSQWLGGYSSPSHPTATLEYKVTVTSYKGEYQFRVKGSGEVLNFQLVKGKRIWLLQPPSLFEEEVNNDQEEDYG